MITSLDHQTWQVLRALLRHKKAHKGKPCPGWRLRLYPSRRNKTGQYLADMVGAGLLSVVPGDPSPPPADADVTEAVREEGPFHQLFDLTLRGHHAAEYGEYDDTQEYADGKI